MADAGPRGAAPLPVWLVTGTRRAARVALIEALLAARPDDQAWGLAASALPLPIDIPPLVLASTLPAGCPCCTGTTPFHVGMTRLLRQWGGANLRRLIVETAEAAHVGRVRAVLEQEAWAARVRVEAVIAVLEAADLAPGAPRALEVGAALAVQTDLLLMAPPADDAARALAAAHAGTRTPDDWQQVTVLARGLIANAGAA